MKKGQKIKWLTNIDGKVTSLVGAIKDNPSKDGSFEAIGSDHRGLSYKDILSIHDNSIEIIS